MLLNTEKQIDPAKEEGVFVDLNARLEEERLIDLARGGDPKAFCDIYERVKDSMYRYALYRLDTREDAEDAVQECMLEAWRQIRTLRSNKAYRTWIFRILSGCCSRRIKGLIRDRDKTGAAVSAQAVETAGTVNLKPGVRRPASATSDSLDPAETVTGNILLTQALEQLEPQARDVVLLSVVGGFTSDEISGMLGLSPGGVRSKLSRSLRRMRAFLEAE